MLHVEESFLSAEEASSTGNPVYIQRPRHLKPSEDLDRISELAKTFTDEVFDHGASWTNVVNVRTGFEALVIIIATEPGSEV